jgi:hypothetical protein
MRSIKLSLLLTAVLTVLMVMSGIVTAQQERTRKLHGGFGGFMFGGQLTDISKLNDRLVSTNYTKFQDKFYTLGGGGYGIINNFIIGGEGHGLMARNGDNTTRTHRTTLQGGGGAFNLGYIIFSRNNYWLYPYFGIGGETMTLSIRSRENPPFDDVLTDPNRSSTLKTSGLALTAGLGWDYLFNIGGNERNFGGLGVGFRIGYTYTPFNEGWQLNCSDIGSGPDISITGPFVRMTIGGGGISKQRVY